MRRKVIKQGIGGQTIFLPAKWTKQQNIQAGDEVEIEYVNNGLLVTPGNKEKKNKKINLSITGTREVPIRRLILNAYRTGFDEIIITANEKSKKHIFAINDTFLLGFDCYQKSENTFYLVSVSEPSLSNFENMIQRQFYMLEYILEQIFGNSIEREIHQIQKYDNFLKRCISKKRFESSCQLWQMLSNITNIGRIAYHYQRIVHKNKLSVTKKLIELFKELKMMAVVLRTSYLKKDYTELNNLHKKDQKENYAEEKNISKLIDPLSFAYFKLLHRLLYVTASPLIGVLQQCSFEDISLKNL